MHILWISLVPNSELQNQIPELESHSKPQIGYEKMINAVDVFEPTASEGFKRLTEEQKSHQFKSRRLVSEIGPYSRSTTAEQSMPPRS
ncbi:hypothetical protein MJO28_015465 [Puccinia striiformis f. sp. tritici]|uniref:Uncharacterized protein n=1 Tax=Puccinia striiformis f. sp. tritici TaxID=168172 RepID=A0ACC0DT08_9BASI|nr:hypothetical protein MJO29_015176 [Puccinia striiformis f. sp. tritici]KAI7938545.1 hypothetical protein MJO28_015465 [Puccinia striiformis f. sp. tritici]